MGIIFALFKVGEETATEVALLAVRKATKDSMLEATTSCEAV